MQLLAPRRQRRIHPPVQIRALVGVRQFARAYRYRYEPIDAKNIPRLYRFVLRWKRMKFSKSDAIAEGEYCMACRLVRNCIPLELCGGLLYAENEVVAITLGTIVKDFSYDDGTHPTAVVHVENARRDFKGAYQVINQLFCQSLPGEVAYVNREDDLGLAGLRKAKLSYHPVKLIEKFNVFLY
jgi:hypothetical protein